MPSQARSLIRLGTTTFPHSRVRMNIMANSEPIAITLQKICNQSLHSRAGRVCGHHLYRLDQVPMTLGTVTISGPGPDEAERAKPRSILINCG
jgi:hypothetical protein